MKRIALRVGVLCLTLSGGAMAQAPAAAPAAAPTAEPQPAAAAPVAAAPAPAPVAAAPAPAPVAAPVAPSIPLSSLPRTRPYRDEGVPPEGYILSEQPRRGFVIGGVAALGAAYITGLIISGVVLDFPNKSAFLAIPAAGPWITLATRDTCDENSSIVLDCADDELARRALVGDGIVQALGVALMVTGLTWTKSVWIREDLANVQLVPGLHVAKLPGDAQPQGLTLIGQF